VESPLGFTIYPYSSRNGETVAWNAVIYDLRNPQEVNGMKQYRFVKLVPARGSPEAVHSLASQMIHDMLAPH